MSQINLVRLYSKCNYIILDFREAKLRDDTVNKLAIIEKTLHDENERRQQEESELRAMVHQQMRSMEDKEEGSSTDLKKVFDVSSF